MLSLYTRTWDSLDPEKLVQCPYDKSHQIRACRFPYHLIKCRKNHPSIANQMATCPFNARHQVPQAEISHHISNCDDKSCIEQDVGKGPWWSAGATQPVSSWQCPPCNEDWDQGKTPSRTCTPCVPPNTYPPGSRGACLCYASNLASGMRVPKSLPYALPWKTRK
uniref:Gametocyte specific factor 1 n=1 Tax=Ornithorhynchus anatinus TaxID=9258 RepID=F6T651_ORNAN